MFLWALTWEDPTSSTMCQHCLSVCVGLVVRALEFEPSSFRRKSVCVNRLVRATEFELHSCVRTIRPTHRKNWLVPVVYFVDQSILSEIIGVRKLCSPSVVASARLSS